MKKALTELPFPAADPARAARLRRIAATYLLTHPDGDGGIGTMQEKKMHAILKAFLSEDSDFHEVGVLDTRFVADVEIGNAYYEVQTGSLSPMKKKLAYYLTHTNREIYILHPMSYRCHTAKFDRATGNFSAPRLSPKKERPLDFLPELYGIRDLLPNERLHFLLFFLETEKYGYDEKRRGKPKKIEEIPTDLLGEMLLSDASDFAALLPPLPERFTAAEFGKITHLRGIDAYSAIHALSSLGVLSESGRIGRACAYEQNQTVEGASKI